MQVHLKGVVDRAARLYARLREEVLLPTEAGQLRRQVLFFVPWPLPVFALVALMVGGGWSAPGWTILLAFSVAVASFLLAVVVQPTPLPEGLSAGASVRRSLHRFRQITALRIGLALAPMLVGAGSSLAGGGLFPLVTALALAWPQLVLAMPLFFTITRARRAMEAWGTKAYLWAALAQPAPVEWPLVTVGMAWYRERRAAAARGDSGSGSGGGDGDKDGSAGDPDAPEAVATDSDLPERVAVPSAEPRIEPGTLIPGFPMSSVVPPPARRALSSGGGRIRRIARSSRARRRPRAKS